MIRFIIGMFVALVLAGSPSAAPQSATSQSVGLPPDPAKMSPPNTRDQLDDAAHKAAERDFGAAYSSLSQLVLTHGFDELDAHDRARAFYLLAWSAYEQKSYEAAHEAAVRSATLNTDNQQLWIIRLGAASLTKDQGDAATSLAMIAHSWPAALSRVSDGLVLGMVGLHDERRMGVLLALHDAHWAPTSKAADPSELWLWLTVDLLAKGDFQRANLIAHDITDYRELIIMHADKRFDAIVNADPGAFDVAKAIRLELERRRADAAASPTSLEAVNELGFSLLEHGDDVGALAIAEGALGKAQVDSGAKPYFEDLDDELNRTLELKSEALDNLGRAEEGIKAGQRGAAHPEHGGLNVSQTLDLAGRLDDLGRPQDALGALQGFDPAHASPFGAMVWRQDLACAYAQLGDQPNLRTVMQEMKARAADGPLALQAALICARDADGLAQVLIAGIEDPETRPSVLLGLQHFLDPPAPRSEWVRQNASFEASTRRRPDVQAAIAKYGRIESYPVREIH